MIEPRQALYAHLRADSAVMATVKDIYQRRVPAGATKPLILIQPTISDVPKRDLSGVAYRQARLQVTVMADTQAAAEKAAKAAMAAVEGYTGTMAGELSVILAAVDNARQIEQAEIEEIHHHVDLMIKYKG